MSFNTICINIFKDSLYDNIFSSISSKFVISLLNYYNNKKMNIIDIALTSLEDIYKANYILTQDLNRE